MKRLVTTIYEPGDRITVHVRRWLSDLCFHNDQRGTEYAPIGSYEVLVENVWKDYETGHRATGRLVNSADIETFRKLACTGETPDPLWKGPAFVMFDGEEMQ